MVLNKESINVDAIIKRVQMVCLGIINTVVLFIGAVCFLMENLAYSLLGTKHS